jgi:hypothetical protein
MDLKEHKRCRREYIKLGMKSVATGDWARAASYFLSVAHHSEVIKVVSTARAGVSGGGHK